MTDDDRDGATPMRLPILPAAFWDARKNHEHIQRAAHARLVSADLVLHAVLARIAAMRSHELNFNSGRAQAVVWVERHGLTPPEPSAAPEDGDCVAAE